MQRLVLGLLTFISTITFTAVAQQTDTTRILTGTVTGHVLDTKGKPVIGATIRIVGTIQGGISKAPDGQFRIAGIRAGIYTIRVTSLGYRPEEIHIKIIENSVATLQVELNDKAIQSMGCFGGRYIEPERFSSTSTITAEDLDRLP